MSNSEPPLPNVSRIVSLESTNVKRLKAVRIEPKGSALVVIGGANEAGKSSVLDSIAMVLGGRNEMPPVPVRKGQKRAQIICDLGEIIVKRTLTKEGGGSLTIEGTDGTKFTSPQALLERLTGKIAFDPVSFMRLDAKRQADTLRQLTGLDLSSIDAEKKRVYEERTAVNRDVDRLKGLHASLPQFPDATQAELSSSDILVKIKQANARNSEIDAAVNGLENLRSNCRSIETQLAEGARSIKTIEDAIAELQGRLAEVKAKMVIGETSLATARQTLAEREKEVNAMARISIEPFETELASVEEINRKVRANQQKETARKQLREKESQASALSQKIDDLESKKNDLMAAVKYPVAGLGFNEDGVTFNDLPLAQSSGAQQLRISVAMAAAMNPRLKVMLVRDGSLLDDANLALLKELAELHQLQVWVERVGKGAECSVIINDGEVEGAETVSEDAAVEADA